MLQINESQLEVYSCSFQLVLGSTYLPLKFKDSCYYFDWKIKNSTSHNQTEPQTVNQYGYLEFRKNLKLHTQILKNIKNEKFLKKYSQLTLFLISSNNPQRPKIVGSMLIELHEILNNKKYSEMKKNKFSLSPLNVEVQFKCLPIECGVSSILQANLDAALVVDKTFLTKSGLQNNCIPYKEEDKNFLKKKITAELIAQDDGLSRGQCSVLEPDLEEAFDNESPIFQRSSLLINSASLISDPHFQLITHIDQDNDNKIKTMQNQDLETLVKENNNLKRLLMVLKAQRKIQAERFEEQNRQLARELSIKQAELLKMIQTHKSGSLKVGELMDEAIWSNSRVIALLKETQSYKQKLTISEQYALQLQQNQKRLEIRLQIVKDWQQERNFLLQKIQALQQQNQHLKIQFYDLQNKKSLAEEQHLIVVRQIGTKLHEFEEQLERRDKIIALYEDKVSKFQEQISLIQEEEVVSRVSYTAISETRQILNRPESSQQGTPKRKGKKSNPIFIEEEGLNRINQEELEESLESGGKQIATATQLPETIVTVEQDFYRKMARNVQTELDQLRSLYREKDITISKQRSNSKSLKQELQRLRFEFVYELSKVTSLLNQKILQIRDLKQENIRLKQKEVGSYESHIFQLQNEINHLQEQRLSYFDRCYRLQQENIALMNLTREKQEIYQSMIRFHGERSEQGKEEELLVSEFQKIVIIMTNNEQRYVQTLKKYGLLSKQRQVPLTNLSQIIKKQSGQYNLSDSDSRTSSAPSPLDLLLESNAKIQVQSHATQDSVFFLQKMATQLQRLSIEREKDSFFLKQRNGKTSSFLNNPSQKINSCIQNLKKTLISVTQQKVRSQLLRLVKHLQQKLVMYIDNY